MSKETSNSLTELKPLQFHIVKAMFDDLQKIFKEEAEAQKKAEKEAKSSYSAPSMPSMPSIPHF